MAKLRERLTIEQVVTAVVLAAITVFLLRQLHPSLLLRNSMPADGDLAAHFYVADHFRDHILPHARLSGWSSGWLTGYPSLTFYFPLAFLFVAVLGFLLPTAVALKLMASAAPLALPFSAYAFGRLNGCTRLTSACFAVAVLPLLLQPSLFFFGGSLAASAGGEFSYGLSLALGLLVVGLARLGLRSGRRQALTAVLLGAAVLLHVMPTFMVVVAMAVATFLRPSWARVRWTAGVLVVGGLLTAFWVLPFVKEVHLTGGLEFPKLTPLLEWLFPVEMLPLLVPAALVGVVALPGEAEKPGDLKAFLVVMTAVSGLVFAVLPGGRLFNGRFLPGWFLWLALLGGYGLSRLAQAVDWSRIRAARGRSVHSPQLAQLFAPIVVFALFLALFDNRDWKGLLTGKGPFDTTTVAEGRFGGYERRADHAEYQDFVDTLRGVARRHGCGRAHAATVASSWADLQLPRAWLLPEWTDGCLTTTAALFKEASATSHFVDRVNAKLVGQDLKNNEVPFDLPGAVAGLRTLGVRYLLATTPETVQRADALSDLRVVARTKTYGDRSWTVYELSEVELVEPLRHLPVVVRGVGRSRADWNAATDRWFESANSSEVVIAASGPASWPRERVVSDAPRRPITPDVRVSRVRMDDDRITFDVSRTGTPVLIKMSYFPNWRASGADGPWRVTPNQMVVRPTSRTVTLRYRRTPVEIAAWLPTLAGMVGVVFLARRGPIDIPIPDRRTPERPTPRPQVSSKRKKRRR